MHPLQTLALKTEVPSLDIGPTIKIKGEGRTNKLGALRGHHQAKKQLPGYMEFDTLQCVKIDSSD